jgi:hypothetical protein
LLADCEVMKLVIDFWRKGAMPLMFHEKIRRELLGGVFASVLRASFALLACLSSCVEDRRRFLLGGGLIGALCILKIDFVVNLDESFI